MPSYTLNIRSIYDRAASQLRASDYRAFSQYDPTPESMDANHWGILTDAPATQVGAAMYQAAWSALEVAGCPRRDRDDHAFPAVAIRSKPAQGDMTFFY